MPRQEEAAAGESEQEKVLLALERFFCSPGFTSALGDFMAAKACELRFVDAEGEQPIQNHVLFTEYQQLVESQLCAFLDEQGVSHEAVLKVCQEAKRASHASSSLVCVEYLLASTDYESFMQLAADHVQLHAWEPEDGALDDWELPADEDEDEGGVVVPLDSLQLQEPVSGAGGGLVLAAIGKHGGHTGTAVHV